MSSDKYFIFNWNIENYAMNGSEAHSPAFYTNYPTKNVWRLYLRNFYIGLLLGAEDCVDVVNNKDSYDCDREETTIDDEPVETFSDDESDKVVENVQHLCEKMWESSREVIFKETVMSKNEEFCITFFLDIIIGNTIIETFCCEDYTFTKTNAEKGNFFTSISDYYKNKNDAEDNLTIRCRILNDKQTIEKEATTKFNFNRLVYNWRIKITNPANQVEERLFYVHQIIKFYMTLTASENIIGIKLRSDIIGFTGMCKISILDVKGYVLHTEYKYLFGGDWECDPEGWNFKSQLKSGDTIFKNSYTLILEFNIPTNVKIHINNLSNPYKISDVYTYTSLHANLGEMFDSKKFTDVELKSKDATFRVHKSILAARSPVFSRMFDHNMSENRTGEVNIPDIDKDILESFLKFVYTAEVDIQDWESAYNLLLAAEKYEVLSLKERCASYLLSALSIENVCDILAVADLVRHEVLKSLAIGYIMSNAGVILFLPEWTKFRRKHFDLASEIHRKLTLQFAK